MTIIAAAARRRPFETVSISDMGVTDKACVFLCAGLELVLRLSLRSFMEAAAARPLHPKPNGQN
jgi:hypothetical protein